MVGLFEPVRAPLIRRRARSSRSAAPESTRKPRPSDCGFFFTEKHPLTRGNPHAHPVRHSALRFPAPGELLRHDEEDDRVPGARGALLLHRQLPCHDLPFRRQGPRPGNPGGGGQLPGSGARPGEELLLGAVGPAGGPGAHLDSVQLHPHGPAGALPQLQGQGRQGASLPTTACSPTRC